MHNVVYTEGLWLLLLCDQLEKQAIFRVQFYQNKNLEAQINIQVQEQMYNLNWPLYYSQLLLPSLFQRRISSKKHKHFSSFPPQLSFNFISLSINPQLCTYLYNLFLQMQKERTSDTHPILVDFINYQWAESGRLGITFAPGKKQKEALTGSWLRDLPKDIERLASFYKIKTLVSMVEKWEMADLKIEDEFEECKRKGIRTYHYPIVDNHIPQTPQEFQRLVKEVVDNCLKKGENVVVHCKGGLGRAPTFACACLLYSGVPLEEAIKLIRTSRRHSLTQSLQLSFLSKLKF